MDKRYSLHEVKQRTSRTMFSGFARSFAKTLCVLSLGGWMMACSDDYKWDNENPSYLNSSIYDCLKEKGNYTNFIRLIDDLNYADVLAKTGSKTLFVADDDAFKTFYASNNWGVGSYEQLSTSQKKLILNSAMVNNAYLLEMMSSTVGPEPGLCLRRETAADVLDSVPHFNGDQLPTNYNPDDFDYWARFRVPSKGGIYMALDNSNQMMTHFLAQQMANKKITDKDFSIIVGQERSKNDAFIYDSKVLEQNITCQNGYVNRLDKVLITPQNMAEMMRTNGKTDIFSHMMDRFSAPFYDAELTARYRLLYGNSVDSVWQKRYFNSQDYRPLQNDQGTDPTGNPNGNTIKFGLTFDPGWNAYQANSAVTKEQDMGVIFAPTDERLYEYFFSEKGGGRFLLEAYAPEEMANVKGLEDKENIYRAVDQIPRDVIQALINNLMKEQFCNSVPSKFETIKDDAQDPMLDETHLDKIQKVLLANNGAIYLMDEVLTPAQYAAVSAPAYVSKDMRVMNYAIQKLTWMGTAKNFYAYLLAMSSRFSLFVPRDGFWYIDPVSFIPKNNNVTPRAIYYDWNEKTDAMRGTSYPITYDFQTGTYMIGDTPMSTGAASSNELSDRLNDILETHTIVHEDKTDVSGIDETATGVECDQHYFLSKNGAPVYVKNAKQHASGMEVQGGWGLQHGESQKVVRFDDKTRETNGNGNGMAYQIDGAIVPTIESVYSALYNNQDKFGKFFELCEADNSEILETLKPYLNKDAEGKDIYTNAEYLKRYAIFVNGGGLPCFDKQTGTIVTQATNVRFFSNYRYTVYVPSDAAIQTAIEAGLPTWQSINSYLELDKEPEQRTEMTEAEEEARNVKAAAMVTALMNFLKYHFQDNSVFADVPALAPTQYETATLNSETGIYCKVTVSSSGNGTLNVKDIAGNTRSVLDNFKNQLVRDYVIASNQISASSFAVMHGIDGVLNYKTLTNGRYDSDWNTTGAAKRFIKNYQIKD